MRRLALAGALLAVAASALAQDAEPPTIESSLNPLSTLDKAALDGFRESPLFTPSRKRPKPPEAAEVEPEREETPPAPPEPEETPAPELKLSGVIQGPDGAVAVVQNEGKVERLRLGDQIGGWLVTAIDATALKLTLNEQEEEFRLFQRNAAEAEEPAEDMSDTPDEPDEPE